ncbi:MAG: hypothetical protein IOD12_13920 [Silvanigrellales bacterium]|nr:hypothetical protein [Silvanigrellales bacterium]
MYEKHVRKKTATTPRKVVVAAFCACFLPGCISVYHYQPLQGLHRSYALSYKEANFAGLTLNLSCIANTFVSESAAGVLCDKLRTVFEGQGAKVLDAESGDAAFDYGLEFEATQTYHHQNAWMWPVSILLFTLFPVEQEYAFKQTVTLTRGSDGSPLRRESFEARFLWFWGAGYWGLNKLFNVTVRNDSEKVDDASMRRDFSRDFYSQVSQLVYNARTRDAFRNAKVEAQ